MIVCIASGPSLTDEDCALVEQSGIPTMAVNMSWQMARFAKYIYAGDRSWWDRYGKDIDIPAERWTCSLSAASHYKIHHHNVRGAYNSGMRAVQWGIDHGYKTIILLGYDCSLKNGVHWHGAYTENRNPTSKGVLKWKRQFEQVALQAKNRGVRVINCSRDTALECFERMKLEDAIRTIRENAPPC